MDAGTHNLKTVFGQDRRHLVPLFQRPYVWTLDEQWEPLWQDVHSIAERMVKNEYVRPHFLGAIVLDQVDVPYGTIETRLIIDGQQRLTTIQILLEAFGDCCSSRGLDAHDKASRRLTRNDDPMITDEDYVFKVWPTNADQRHFRKVMLATSPAGVLAGYGLKPTVSWTGHRIADAYLFFFRQIDSWIREDLDNIKVRADSLLATLRDALRLVVIDLKDDDDAQVIFETLNARGTPLLPSDLIKNHLFLLASRSGMDVDKLYKRYWQEFDELATYWRKELGRGHAQRARIDLFMQYYLTLKSHDEVPVAHLYSSFRKYCAVNNALSAEEHFKDLQRYSSVYRSFDGYAPQSRQGRFFRRLAAMDTTTAYPFLLELFSLLGAESGVVLECLDLVESFLVRRLVCKLNNRGYNRLFADMLGVLEGEPDATAKRLETFLASGRADSNRWPSDAEFSNAFRTTPIYRALARSRVYMLLDALNNAMHDGKSEQFVLENLTIEHLMPQEWSAHWPLPEGVSPEVGASKRNQVVHALGNLTLLTKRLNPSISNGPWPDKVKEILRYSALNLNRELPGAWGEEPIQARGEALAIRACELWSAPVEVRNALAPQVTASLENVEAALEVVDDIDTTRDTSEERILSPRQQVLKRFWSTLVERSKARTQLLMNRSAAHSSWLNAPSGRSGFNLNLVITEQFASVECYIRVKGQDKLSKAVFRSLLAQRDAIEIAFGEALEWNELPDRIGSRISKTIPGSWRLDEAAWPELQDTMIDALMRLEKAVHQPVREIIFDEMVVRDEA